ncbi:MAG: LiaI-LiaF-like domain-containing protein [Terracidiphilus sp.]
MNRFILIRRLRGPLFLLLFGVVALFDETNILSWGKSWPLFLILAGVLALAERVAPSAERGDPQGPVPGQPYPGSTPYAGASVPAAAAGVPPYPGQSAAIVSAPPHDLVKNNSDEGGQS